MPKRKKTPPKPKGAKEVEQPDEAAKAQEQKAEREQTHKELEERRGSDPASSFPQSFPEDKSGQDREPGATPGTTPIYVGGEKVAEIDGPVYYQPTPDSIPQSAPGGVSLPDVGPGIEGGDAPKPERVQDHEGMPLLSDAEINDVKGVVDHVAPIQKKASGPDRS